MIKPQILKDSMFNNPEMREKTKSKHSQRLIEMGEQYENILKSLANSLRINDRQKGLFQSEVPLLKKLLQKNISDLFDRMWELENTTSPDQVEQTALMAEYKEISKELKAYKEKNNAFSKIIQDYEDIHRMNIAVEQTIIEDLGRKDQYSLKLIAIKSMQSVLDGVSKPPKEVESGMDYILWFLTEFDKIQSPGR